MALTNITAVKELAQLYNASDRLYAQFARSCGLSSCAYWMAYELVCAGGEAPLTEITAAWAYSKQTINSALKSLESQGLVTLAFCAGSKKNKRASLTDAGRKFAQEQIEPAMAAEQRAFDAIAPEEGEELLTLLRSYTASLNDEFARMTAGDEP